ncbi:hypothetical protein KZ820_14430 [Sphingomonas sp. RRHST34]|uniref:Uncharacterized protein n=1 Tax=Sphingomonas citri TaxID=2862499 RepID=A0ABS7BQZ0_9SPHN|nr:hypothetical protein [Sphingomonas citri]MBW6531935.1 hypothetical protein [Sphingomonas citri]
MSDPTVPVAVHGFTWTAALVAFLNVLVGGGIVGGIIKVWPMLKKLSNEREAAVASLRRDDMDDMRQRITELEKKVDDASSAAHAAEMKLVHAVAAVQLLAAKIRADNPEDPTLRQAMELLAAATTGTLGGWATKLADSVDKVKGTGE